MLDFGRIAELAAAAVSGSDPEFAGILDKARRLEGLSLEDVAKLLATAEPSRLQAISRTALDIKKMVFGDRIVLFAPLYLSNECGNQCLYCGFQAGNAAEDRKTLTVEEAVREAQFLGERGFRRVLLVTAENSGKCGPRYIAEVAEAIYNQTPMRIVHLNAAPMDVADLRILREAGIGVFQVFQETYHRQTYEALHVKGRKMDFDRRLNCMDRAFEAGFRDLGIGALLGLHDYRFDVLATIAHACHLRDRHGSFPHTISVPRFRHADGAMMEKALSEVDDATFKKITAVYRLAVPTAGVVISTRESAAVREEILSWGASQISAESSTTPGGYTRPLRRESGAQFSLNDTRQLEQIVAMIFDQGMLPSFCASCYRKGREGGRFHELAAEGGIRDFCEHNAYASLLEYIGNQKDERFRNYLEQCLDRYRAKYEDSTMPGKLI